MKTARKIVKLFLRETKQRTIRGIAGEIEADYRITHMAVQRLLASRILTVQTVGKSSLCQLNAMYYGPEIYEAEDERRQDILKNGSIRQLHKELAAKLKTGFYVLLLFGSYAKGTQTRASDIDLLFISNEKNFESKVSNILSLLPPPVHTLVFTEEEFVRMKDAKAPNVVQEAIAHRVILYGIEAYHRIQNA